MEVWKQVNMEIWKNKKLNSVIREVWEYENREIGN